MQAVGSAKLVYLVWLVGGVLSFAGALTYAELGAMKPEAGGEYVYVRDAYGPMAGFLYAWTTFLIAKPASIATITTGLVRILGTFPVLRFFSATVVTWPFTITCGQVAAVAAAILISLLNYLGIKKAGEFQRAFTLLKVAIILVIVVAGFSYGGGGWKHFAGSYTGAIGGIEGFMSALVAALWAYDGWNDLNMVSGEIRNPGRNIPVALVLGVAVVAALYMLVNAAVQFVLPASVIGASARPASEAMALVIGKSGAGLVAAAMAISMLVTLNGSIMSGARVPFAVARDRYFFAFLGEVHPKFRTPSMAIAAQCLLACALLLIGGSFRQFFSLAIFSEWLFYMIAASTVFVFRTRNPPLPRPFQTLGYPLVPALFVLASGVLLYYTFTSNLSSSIVGSLVILAGIPVFYAFARKRQS
jgi:APA family basic amino acid/polyamine antiporter